VAVTVEEVVIKESGSGDLAAAAKNVDKLSDALGGLKKAGKDSALGGINAEQKAMIASLEKERSLVAQLATFDAKRVKAQHDMTQELARRTKLAINGPDKPAASSGGPDLTGIAGGVTAGVAAIGAAAVVATGAALVAGGKLAISATMFREQTETSFEFLLGSSSKARSLYESALTVADKVGLEKENVVSSLKQMITSGSGEAEALASIEAAGNLAAVLDASAADKLLDLYAGAKAKGTFDAKQIKALAGLGIQTEQVYEKLAASTGKSMAQVKAEVKAGKLDAQQGIDAVNMLINDRGGVGEKAGGNLDRIVGDVQGHFVNLFDSVDFGPLKTMANSVLAGLDGPAGAKAESSINRIFAALTGAAAGGTGGGLIEKLIGGAASGLEAMATAAEAAAPFIQAIIEGLGEGLGDVGSVLSEVGGAISEAFGGDNASTVQDVAGAFKLVARAVVYVVAAIAVIVGVVAVLINLLVILTAAIGGGLAAAFMWLATNLEAVGAWFSNLGSTISGAVGSAIDAAGSIGSGIIDGITSGISSGASSVASAITSVAKSAIAAAKGALGISSPSRVFAGIGGFTAQGFAMGIDQGSSDVRDAAAAMAGGAVSGATVAASLRASNDNASAISGGAPGSRGGGGIVINGLNVNQDAIKINPAADATPDQVRAQTEAAHQADGPAFRRKLFAALREAS
jgi:hypothetical protein